jgi:putative membrane-bound dehydrogenase-like protein
MLMALNFSAMDGATAVDTGITVPEGFEVIAAAKAPLISFPMLGGFDDRGRLFLAENAGVNLDEKTLDAQLPSRIRMLEDTDGDGVFDRSTVFADKFAFPQGALWHDGALYVTSAPSIWRVEDKDGDGRADSRVAIVTGFKSTGNAADVHGPFLHPNGRLFWCHGRKGHEVYQNNGGALVSKGLGARIWSCRPDGSDIQVHAGGGMDNPVEVAFNQEGDVFGTANIFQGTPRNDAVIHWVHGGVYPRSDQEPVLAEFRRTGELLPPISLIGHVAPAGITLPRAGTLGEGYRDNLFFAEFNTRRIMRLPLERNGSTYRGAAQAFATAADPGVHFTDVIEDADGSLLLVDTGAWFRRGCPTSVVSRADIMGAIYRVRRKGAPSVTDPRGLAIAWDKATDSELVALLGDARVAVRDRAVGAVARRGDAAVSALRGSLRNSNHLVKSNALWALTRIGTSAAQEAAREALYDLDARTRQVACASAFATADRAASELLVAKLGDDSQAVQREAAHALGRLRDPRAVTALGGAAAIPRDPMLSHALILALIEIAAPAETKKLLAHREPLARRAALIALDRGSPADLPPEPVFAALRDPIPALHAAALDIAVRRKAWSPAIVGFLSNPSARISRDVLAKLLTAFLASDDVRSWVRRQLAEPEGVRKLDAKILLGAIAANPALWDDAWRELLTRSLRSPDATVAAAALSAAAAHRTRNFSDALREVGRDPARSTAFRVSALQLAAGGDSALDAESFALLLAPLVKGGATEERQQAASVIGAARLDAKQLLELADHLPHAGPVELQHLLGAYQRGPALAEVGAKLLAQLKQSPGRWGVMQTTLQQIFQRYPAPAYENAAPLIAEIMSQNVARDGRLAELETQVAGGDTARGKTAFLNGAGACVSCHRIADTGAAIGPDLTQIGRIRNTRDLLEAIAFPNASIARGYETFQIATKEGRTLTGRIPRESTDTVYVLGSDGREEPVARASVVKFEPIPMSLMPPGLDRAMDARTLADLVAFLKSLQ